MLLILQMRGLSLVKLASKYWRYWAQLQSHFLHEAFWIFLTTVERSCNLYAPVSLGPHF